MDNSKFDVCSSYPEEFVSFEMFADTFYKQIGSFRARSRLPLLSAYYANDHKKVGFVTFWRCSQPHVGFFKKRNFLDEYFVQIVGNPDKKLTLDQYMRAKGNVKCQTDVHIYDMRGKNAVMGNKLQGKGSEDSGYYANASLFFSNIPNIHKVRDSFNSMMTILNRYSLHL